MSVRIAVLSILSNIIALTGFAAESIGVTKIYVC
jgi:hypothetical protein